MMKMDTLEALFAGAWHRYKERFWTLIWIFVGPSVIFFLGQLLLGEKAPSTSTATWGALFSIVGSLASLIASLALINALAHGTDIMTSYRVGLKLFWAAAWICILELLAVAGGFVLLIVPAIMLGIGLMFATYALVVEDKRGMQALLESREYVKGYWWAVLGRILLLGIIFSFLLALLYAPSMLLFGMVVGTVVYFVLFLCFTTFGTCYTFGMYENLRRLKAGTTGASGAASPPAAQSGRKFLLVCITVGVIAILAVIISATYFALGG